MTAADNTERLHELYEGFNDIRAELEDAVILKTVFVAVDGNI